MHKKNFSRFRYTPVFLAMILCGTCHAAPAGFWENYQAPNDTALTTTAETYDTGRNSKTGAVSLTINQTNAAGVRTVVAHPNGASAYLPGTSNSNVVLYEAERGSNVFVGKMETGSHTYTITSTYDTKTGKFNTVAVDEKGNAARGIASTITVTELSNVTYKSGEITKVTNGSADQQGYFQTNTVTKTGQVTGKKTESTATVRVGDIVTAKNGTNNGQNTMVVYVNGEKQAELTDTNTVTSAGVAEGDKYLEVNPVIENSGKPNETRDYTFSLTDYAEKAIDQVEVNSGNIEALQSTKADRSELKTYKLDSKELTDEEKSSGVVSKVELVEKGVDSEGKEITNIVGTFADTDTNTIYTLSQETTPTSNETKITLKGSDDEVSQAIIRTDNTATITEQDGTAVISVKGTNYEADSGTVTVKPGETLGVKGDGNIKTVASGSTISVELADDITVNSVKAKTEVKVGDTTIDKDGVKTNRVQVGSVVFTPNSVSMGGQQVHGVAAGTADTDAVNFAQLKATEAQFNQRLGDMDNHINRVEDNAYAGVAMALATAGLPQAWQPGKSMIAAAAGTYMGEQGYAIGFSHNTENGKWTLKGTASGNSQGHFGGSVGAGYMW